MGPPSTKGPIFRRGPKLAQVPNRYVVETIGRRAWLKWRRVVPPLTVKARLLKTQVDRIAGRIALQGQVGDIRAFCPNPEMRDSPPMAKVVVKSYMYETEPIEVEDHTFYVPLYELEVVN